MNYDRPDARGMADQASAKSSMITKQVPYKYAEKRLRAGDTVAIGA